MLNDIVLEDASQTIIRQGKLEEHYKKKIQFLENKIKYLNKYERGVAMLMKNFGHPVPKIHSPNATEISCDSSGVRHALAHSGRRAVASTMTLRRDAFPASPVNARLSQALQLRIASAMLSLSHRVQVEEIVKHEYAKKDQLIMEKSALEAGNANLRIKLSELLTEKAELEQKLTSLEDEVESSRKKEHAAERRIRALAKEIEALHRDIAELRPKAETVEEKSLKLGALEVKVQKLKVLNKGLSEENIKLTYVLEDYEDKFNEYTNGHKMEKEELNQQIEG